MTTTTLSPSSSGAVARTQHPSGTSVLTRVAAFGRQLERAVVAARAVEAAGPYDKVAVAERFAARS